MALWRCNTISMTSNVSSRVIPPRKTVVKSCRDRGVLVERNGCANARGGTKLNGSPSAARRWHRQRRS
eukprot:7431253-Lingulodinium_polyedra.AAC.1